MAASYTGRTPWSKAHSSWLCGQTFEHPAHQIVLAEYRHAIEEAEVPTEATDRTSHGDGGVMVYGAGGEGLSGNAGGRLHDCGHLCRGNRRRTARSKIPAN